MKQDPEVKTTLQNGKASPTAHPFAPKSKNTEVFRRQPAIDADLITDIRVSVLVQSPRGGSIILWIILIVFFCALAWAYVAEVEEVTRASGKVVPSRQLQIIQNLEGGIVSEIMVSIGDVVEKGQLLLRIDEKRFSGPYRESRFNYLALKAQVARLQSETKNTPFSRLKEFFFPNANFRGFFHHLFRNNKGSVFGL